MTRFLLACILATAAAAANVALADNLRIQTLGSELAHGLPDLSFTECLASAQ